MRRKREDVCDKINEAEYNNTNYVSVERLDVLQSINICYL